ncbi:hypothetical protein D9T14_05450 [Propionibacterium australiense]|uniref:Uncharacterized protein n=1 Tax=Propionibacterium australiense TaxID=119981 RepID=A0A8B3FUS7_9ACTN|nr:hypothetical protein D9T14_05450 [Propionibacterium australiense]RLP12982.1 hypothetical protein D7U36_00695 [Propionibacterium australiense]
MLLIPCVRAAARMTDTRHVGSGTAQTALPAMTLDNSVIMRCVVPPLLAVEGHRTRSERRASEEEHDHQTGF